MLFCSSLCAAARVVGTVNASHLRLCLLTKASLFVPSSACILQRYVDCTRRLAPYIHNHPCVCLAVSAQVYGTANITPVNATTTRVVGPVFITVVVRDGATNVPGTAGA